MSYQAEHFAAVASRHLVRPSVRAIIIHDSNVLVQKPADEPESSYAFIGGEYELGDTIDSRLRQEIEEETNALVVTWSYLFVAENFFVYNGQSVHCLEHFCEVEIDRTDIESRDGHLLQVWLPIDDLSKQDLRPWPIRDLIHGGGYRDVRHMVVDERS